MRPSADKIRSISPEEIHRLKRATEEAYRQAGGVSLVALRCRASISQLSKYASTAPENAETAIPLDVAIEADRAAGSPVILSVHAEILGFEVVPKGAGGDDDEITEMDAHRVGQKAMELATEIFRALEDGETDALERRAIADKCHRLKRIVNNVLRRLR